MKFVIYSPGFSYDTGGVIALDVLADRLNKAGHQASIWPSTRPRLSGRPGVQHLKWAAKTALGKYPAFDNGPFSTRPATYADLDGAVVVYPETISGNPLKARHVVRWLLNKPGLFTGHVDYSADDLFFYFMDAFNDARWNVDPENELCLTWDHPAYQGVPDGERSGTCHMFRKGAGRGLDAPAGSILLDGLGHDEAAAVFQTTERFICFDLYTRYAIYAAVCGCLPIVIPEPGMTEAEWMPDPEDRLGVAYGETRVPWARRTRDRLRERLAEQATREDAILQRFVRKCEARFSPGS